jgi:hypothetical protein
MSGSSTVSAAGAMKATPGADVLSNYIPIRAFAQGLSRRIWPHHYPAKAADSGRLAANALFETAFDLLRSAREANDLRRRPKARSTRTTSE